MNDGQPLERTPELPHAGTTEGWPERLALWLAMLAMAGVLLLVAGGLLARNLFAYSIDFVDEYSGYLVVAAFFFSVAACQTTGNFHQIDLFRARLTPVQRARLDILMHVVCLVACLVLLWFLVRFTWQTWTRSETANTMMGTPLWIPRISMPIGTALLCWAMLVSIRRLLVAIRGMQGALPRSHPLG